MKRVKTVILALMLFFLGISNTFALDVSLKSVSVDSQSVTTRIIDAGINGDEITPKLEFNKVGDFIKYKIVLNNNDGKNYKIVSVTDDNSNEYVKMEYSYDTQMDTSNKSLFVTVKYAKEIENPDTQIDSIRIIITLVDEDDNTQTIPINNKPITPNTVDTIFKYASLLAVSAAGIVIIVVGLKKKKDATKAVVIMLLLVPMVTMAVTTLQIKIMVDTTNIQINKYYTVSFDSDGGSSVKPQSIQYQENATRPEDPTKTGYNFTGWVDEDGNEFDFNTPITGQLKLKAAWEKKEYTVTFDSNGGTPTPDVQTVKYQELATRPADPTKDKHEFVKWVDENGNEYNFNNPVEKNINLTAEWIELFTVTFNSNEGTPIPDSQTVRNGEKINLPTEPSKTGYNFVAWEDANGEYNFNTPVTTDFTLNAKWNPIKYNVVYELDGGVVEGTNPTTYTIEDTFTLINPTKEGHEFKGWIKNDGDTPTLLMSVPVGTTGDLYFEAVFNEIHTVTFDTDGGTVIDPVEVEYGQTVSRPADPEKEGYNFIKWLDHHGNEFVFSNPILQNTTITAEWEAIKYSITYNLDGGTVEGTNPATYTIETNTFTLINPTKEGKDNEYKYIFRGWSGTDLDEQQMEVKVQKGSIGDREYTANWEKQYYVTFEVGNGTTSETSRWVKENNSIGSLPEVSPNPGYIFIGWSVNDAIIDQNHLVNNVTTVVAKYELIEYNYTMNLDGGSYNGSTNPISGKYTTDKAWTLWSSENNLEPTKEGYKFIGWTGENYTDYELTTIEIPQGSIGDKEYTANWKKIHTVTFNTNGGTEIEPAKVVDGEKVGLPAEPTKTGHNFIAWEDANGEYNFNTPVTTDFTLNAKWEKKEYTVTFDSNGGTPTPDVQTVKYQELATRPADPTRDKHEFIKWVDVNGNEYDFATPVEDNITLTAEWIELYTITYNSNGGTEVDSQTVRKGETFTEPADPTKEHYVFTKWLNGLEGYDFETPANSDIELLAQWTPKEYTITYILNGGEDMLDQNPLTYNIETPTFMIYPVFQEGYTFNGWTGSNGDVKQMMVSVPTGTTGDLTYEAHFTINEYTVTFDAKEGTPTPETQTVQHGNKATRPTDPVRTGFELEDWLMVQEIPRPSEAPYDFNEPVKRDIHLIAKWTPIRYTITYNLDGGAVEGTNPTSYTILSSFTLINPTKEGHNFIGWTGTDLTEPTMNVYYPGWSTVGDREYTANWEKKEYTVTFDSNGGTDVEEQKVKYEEFASVPEEPTRTGYNFVEWQDEDGNAYNFATPVKGDITLKAVWEKKEYTVTFNSNGGTEVEEQKVKYEELATLPEEPTRRGYNFVAWEDANGEYSFNTPVTTDFTLTAKWEKKEYTVTFDSNGGTEVEEQKVKFEELATEPTKPTKDKHEFVRWLDASGNTYDFATPVEEDITLTAEWIELFTVTYDADGGEPTPQSQTVRDGEKYTKPADPTKEHYEFVHWMDGTAEYIFDNTVSSDKNLKAKWIPKEYTITYELDEGVVEGTNPTSYNIETETFTLINPTKEDHVFVGWIEDEGDVPQLVMTVSKGTTGNLYFEAVFNEIHTVTFDTVGAAAIDPVKVEHGQTVSRPADPEKEGYTFIKWLDHNSNEYDFATPVINSITLTAEWEKNEYTVSFNTNGGTPVPENQKVKYQETATKPSDPTKEHYIFKKWLDENGNEFSFDTQITKDTTLTAVWDKEQYTVTYDSKGGSAVASETVEYQETFTKPTNPTRTGYRFIGWLDENNAAYNFDAEATKDITLTADWQIINYTISYELDGGSVEGTNPTTYNVESDTITLINPTKPGSTMFGGVEKYEFAGWTGSNGTTPQLEVTIPTGSTGNKNYTANFTHFWKAYFNPSGPGTISEAERFVEENTAVGTLPTVTPEEGYEFKGWLVSDHDVTEQPTDGSHVIKGPTIFIAVIEPIEYTVTLDANGGSYSGTTSKTYNIETSITMWDPATDAEPTRSGYKFKGWTGNGITEPSKAKIEIPVGTTGDKTYTANWVEEFTVTFDSDGGTAVAAQAVEIGDVATIPTEPTKENYIFKYWMDEEGNEYNFATPITGNKTLTAKWQVAKSTISSTDTGSDNTLNLKMKQLANPGETITSGYNFDDTATQAFKRATDEEYNAIKSTLTNDNIVSTSDSLTPVYMWFDSGTMYWYSEAAKVEFTGSMGRLFAKYTALTDISGFADFDTSQVTDMNRIFQNCSSLNDEIIKPLENWDVSNVTTLQFAFGGGNNSTQAPKIKTFDAIKLWNVGKVTNFNQMVKYNPVIENLDSFENWNMTSATNISNMFTGTTALTDASAIKGWNVINVTTSGFGNVFSSSKIIQGDGWKSLPEFTERPGAWTSTGRYNPTS